MGTFGEGYISAFAASIEFAPCNKAVLTDHTALVDPLSRFSSVAFVSESKMSVHILSTALISSSRKF